MNWDYSTIQENYNFNDYRNAENNGITLGLFSSKIFLALLGIIRATHCFTLKFYHN